MAFTDTQARQLKAKLHAEYVKTRKQNGTTLHYVEGWHTIAEANRIFGFDGWDRRTLSTVCIWSGMKAGQHCAAYTASVRVSVRAGDAIVVREGSGTGEATAPTIGQAHELALKGAETDATKRALATFGNPFGLALYDPEQTGVRKARNARKEPTEEITTGPWILHVEGASDTTFTDAGGFAEALRNAMSEARDIELLFAIWEKNVDAVRAINRHFKQANGSEAGLAQSLVQHLKASAVALVNAGKRDAVPAAECRKIDKSVLTLSEPKRHRSKDHLRFVARQACLICGRLPSHAHHIRYAQSRGLGLKVSDEFTVPLCAIHHDQLHATGNERQWWEKQKLDPLTVAQTLWKRHLSGSSTLVDSSEEIAENSGPFPASTNEHS